MANKFRIKYNNNIIADNLDLNSIYTKTLPCTGKLMSGNIAIEVYKNSRLPDGFQECEYISTSGTQYIDTNFIPEAAYFKLQYKFKNAILFGTSNVNASTTYNFAGYSSATEIRVYCGNSGANSVESISSGTTYERIIEANNGTNKIMDMNGNVTATHNYSGNLRACGNYNFPIFRRTETSEHTDYSTGTLYYAMMYTTNNVLVRNYVPCYSTTTVTGYQGATAVSCAAGTIGLYDLVNSRFYINSGSGTFTKGPDVDN